MYNKQIYVSGPAVATKLKKKAFYQTDKKES